MKIILRVALITVIILLIPLIAMQFTDEVDWNHTDFIVAGILIFSVGLIFEFLMKKVGNNKYRYLIGVIVLIIFLLIWAELGVGIFGTPFAGS
jgi:type IV secretory pathway VirB2 component (pilin)